MAPGPDQGLDDERGDGRRIRAAPPDSTLAWVSGIIKSARPSSRSRRWRVGARRRCTSWPRYAPRTARRSGSCCGDTCYRRCSRRIRILVAQEAAALEVVDPLPVPTPRLLAVDGVGEDADVPALVISELPGRAAWLSRDAHRWMRAMAEAVTRHPHARCSLLPRASGRSIGTHKRHTNRRSGRRTRRCGSARSRSLLGDVPAHESASSTATSIPATCCGSGGGSPVSSTGSRRASGRASVDIGHCRANLMFDDPPCADIFTRMWEEISGSTYDPWGDVATVIGMLDGLRDGCPAAPARGIRSRTGTCGDRARMTVRRDEFPPHRESRLG